MTLDTATYDLPPSLNVEECQKLFAFFQKTAGSPISLNCAATTRLGGLAAQLICVAAKSWAAENIPFALVQRSAGFRESIETLDLAGLLDNPEDAQ